MDTFLRQRACCALVRYLMNDASFPDSDRKNYLAMKTRKEEEEKAEVGAEQKDEEEAETEQDYDVMHI